MSAYDIDFEALKSITRLAWLLEFPATEPVRPPLEPYARADETWALAHQFRFPSMR